MIDHDGGDEDDAPRVEDNRCVFCGNVTGHRFQIPTEYESPTLFDAYEVVDPTFKFTHEDLRVCMREFCRMDAKHFAARWADPAQYRADMRAFDLRMKRLREQSVGEA